MNWEAATKAINDDGWTCDMHEPNDWCPTCQRLQKATAMAVVAAWADDKVLYKVCPDCNGNGSMDAPSMLGGLEQECLRCQAMGGLVQVWPDVSP